MGQKETGEVCVRVRNKVMCMTELYVALLLAVSLLVSTAIADTVSTVVFWSL